MFESTVDITHTHVFSANNNNNNNNTRFLLKQHSDTNSQQIAAYQLS